ncbi:MAG: CRISPR-associated helicase Cas3' [Thermoplasmataceae archaeon]
MNNTEAFLKCNEINIDKFWDQMAFLVLNHDFGKLNEKFQEKIKKVCDSPNGRINAKERKEDIPHNFISSLYFTNKYFRNIIPGDNINICALVAANHHGNNTIPEGKLFERQKTVTLLNVEEYSELDKENDDLVYLIPEKKAIDELKKELDSNILSNNILKYLLVEPKSENNILIRRWLFSLMKQYLHLSDWTSSGENITDVSIIDPWDQVENILKERVIGKTNLRSEVQSTVSKLGNRGILIAPTGSGKTEASIKWAQSRNIARIMMTLPTRSLVDDIYYRFQGNGRDKGYFQNKTGILHASSEFVYKDSNLEDKNSHKYDKYFYRPIMLSTIDQILFSLFNYGKWDAINFALIHGCLIVDEVHSYDKFTLSLLIELINQTSKFNLPILLMTATLPSWVQKGIEMYTGESWNKVEVKPELNSNIWEIEIIYKNNIKNIVENASDKNILIVVNNVKECIKIYNEMKGKRLTVCLHSRFIQSDKKNKIDLIKSKDTGPKVVVSTQVIEVGIDIDYDILITELCPVDSIIQRAGRVNRSRVSSKTAKIYVFKSDSEDSEISKLIYGEETLKRTMETLSYLTPRNEDVQKAIDYVYPEEDEIGKLKEYVESTHKLVMEWETFEGRGKNKNGDGVHSLPVKEIGNLIKTREQKYITVEVVPEKFRVKVNEGMGYEYTFNVPLKSFIHYIQFAHGGPAIIKLGYNGETGLENPEELNHEAFFI